MRLINNIDKSDPCLLFDFLVLGLISAAFPKLQQASLFTVRFQVVFVAEAEFQIYKDLFSNVLKLVAYSASHFPLC